MSVHIMEVSVVHAQLVSLGPSDPAREVFLIQRCPLGEVRLYFRVYRPSKQTTLQTKVLVSFSARMV